MRVATLRALARVELRQLSRHVGRSLLVVLLVAVPVAAIAGGSALLHITQRTQDEEQSHLMGAADLRVGADWTTLTNLSAYERATFDRSAVRASELHQSAVVLGAGPARLVARLGCASPRLGADSAGERLTRGLYEIVDGRAPTAVDEVALARVLLEGLSVEVGDEIRLGPTEERLVRARVVGEVVDPESLDAPVAFASGVGAGLPAFVDGPHSNVLLALEGQSDEEAIALAAALREAGIETRARSEIGGSDGFEAVVIFVLGGLGFVEAALVIAAAFAVGVRRRQREIGLLGATGATPGGVQWSLLVSAAALAVAGSAVGVAVGWSAARLMHPNLDGWNRRLNGPFEVSVEFALVGAALGLVTAVLAAALPARTASLLPIRVQLSGRRPLTTRAGGWLGLGLALVGTALALVFFGLSVAGKFAALGLLVGAVLGVCGFGACSPWLLDALARRAAPLPASWRLAVRDAGRFRARNGPVVTAVLAGMAISISIAVMIRSLERTVVRFADLRSDQFQVDGPAAESLAARLAEEFDGVALAPLAAAYSNGQLVSASVSGREAPAPRGGWIAVGDGALAGALAAESAAAAFERGELVALFDLNVSDRQIEQGAAPIRASAGVEASEAAQLSLAVAKQSRRVDGPPFVLHEATARELGWQLGPPPRRSLVPWIVRTEKPVSLASGRRAMDIAAEFPGCRVRAESLDLSKPRVFLRIVLLVCLATGLIVIMVATSLTSVESAADARVLHAVGASPTLLRRHAAARAGYLAFLGCVLALPAGLIPALGLLQLSNFALPFVLPWREVLVTVFGLPILAYATTWTGSWLRELRPRRSARRGLHRAVLS